MFLSRLVLLLWLFCAWWRLQHPIAASAALLTFSYCANRFFFFFSLLFLLFLQAGSPASHLIEFLMCFSLLAILFFLCEDVGFQQRELSSLNSSSSSRLHAVPLLLSRNRNRIHITLHYRSERAWEWTQKTQSKLKDNFCTTTTPLSLHPFGLSFRDLLLCRRFFDALLLLRLITLYWCDHACTHLHADLCAYTALNCTMWMENKKWNSINHFINQQFLLGPLSAPPRNR